MKSLVKGTVVKVWLRPNTGEMLEGNAKLIEEVNIKESMWKVQFITGGGMAVREINRINA